MFLHLSSSSWGKCTGSGTPRGNPRRWMFWSHRSTGAASVENNTRFEPSCLPDVSEPERRDILFLDILYKFPSLLTCLGECHYCLCCVSTLGGNVKSDRHCGSVKLERYSEDKMDVASYTSSPTNHSSCQKSRWMDLLYGIKMLAEDSLVLS